MLTNPLSGLNILPHAVPILTGRCWTIILKDLTGQAGFGGDNQLSLDLFSMHQYGTRYL